jgi:hypothetical protein
VLAGGTAGTDFGVLAVGTVGIVGKVLADEPPDVTFRVLAGGAAGPIFGVLSEGMVGIVGNDGNRAVPFVVLAGGAAGTDFAVLDDGTVGIVGSVLAEENPEVTFSEFAETEFGALGGGTV